MTDRTEEPDEPDEQSTDADDRNAEGRGPAYVGTEGEQVGSTAATVRRRVDMTRGPLLRGIFYLSWPIVATSLLQVAVGIADIKMVGALGPDAIAAVGISRVVVFILVAFSMATATGMQVLVAQYSGRDDTEGVDRTVKQGLMAAAVITLGLVTPLGIGLSPWIMAQMGATDPVMAAGVPYMRIMFAGMLLMVLSFVTTAALQGAGDTLTPLKVLLLTNVLNIIISYLFIFGVGPVPRMEVAGAAVGTVASRLIGAIVGLIILICGRYAVTLNWRTSWAVQWRLMGRIFHLGVPAAIQHITRSLGGLLVMRILAMTAAGMYAVSGFTVAMQIQMVTGMVGLAMMASATTSVGQNMGAGLKRRAVRSAWASVAVAASISALAALTYATFARFFIGIFTDDTHALAVGVQALVVLAFAEPFMTSAMSLSGSLRGAGDAYSPMYLSVATVTVMGPALAYLLAIPLEMDTMGVWLALAVSQMMRFSLIAWVFKRGGWQRIRLVDD